MTIKLLGRGVSRLSVDGIILDIDNTLYPRSKGYMKEGGEGEIGEIAKILNISNGDTLIAIKNKKDQIGKYTGRSSKKIALTEAVYALGIAVEDWSEMRCRVWQPEKWIFPDPEITELITELSKYYEVLFGTNSPIKVGLKILRILGIPDNVIADNKVMGPENLDWISKPDPQFFSKIAEKNNLEPFNCISIGDREFSDGPPALESNYRSAVIISDNRNDLMQFAYKHLL